MIGLDIDAITPGISGNQFTASELSSVVVANDFMPPTQTVDVVVPVGVVNVVPATNAEFTTVGSTAQLETALQINPDANIPIVNNVGYQGLADAELAARNGAGGATQFDAGGSFAHMQDDSLHRQARARAKIMTPFTPTTMSPWPRAKRWEGLLAPMWDVRN